MNKIHQNDDMFHGSIEHYDSVGNEMTNFVEAAVKMVDNPQSRILELPCGYGRVTRKLVEKFDSSRIFVAEIMKPALDFCVEQFGVSGYLVEEPVNEFRNIPDESFDVAIMGSLITHLSEEDSQKVFEFFFQKVKFGGIGIITTTGVKARSLLEHSVHYQENVCQVGVEGRRNLIDSYDKGVFGYSKYVHDHTFEQKTVDLVGDVYGYSMIPKVWIEANVKNNNLSILKFIPGGWDDHQDVFFISKQ